MNDEFGRLLFDLWGDLQQPAVIWQLAALLVSAALALLTARLVRRSPPAADTAAAKVGYGGLRRVAFPITALLLVLAARSLLRPWMHVNVLSVAVPLLLSLAVIRVVFFVLRLSFRGPWLSSFEKVFALVAWGVVALHLTGLLPAAIEALESVGFSVGRQQLNLWLILQGAGALLSTLLLALWIGGAIEGRLMAAQGLDANLRVVFSRLSKATLILVAVLVGLPMVGIDLTTLSVFGGAVGVGLGFGLQKIAANYISGFIILLDRSIRIGDVIAVGGDRGQVTKITTRYTVLKGLSGVEAIVPNEVLVGSVVQNESYTDTRVRVGLPVQVSYATDLEQALEVLVAAAQIQSRVLADPPAKAFVVAFADSGIDLELGFWIDDPAAGISLVRSEINLEIWRRFKAAGIEIPFPQREVRLIDRQ